MERQVRTRAMWSVPSTAWQSSLIRGAPAHKWVCVIWLLGFALPTVSLSGSDLSEVGRTCVDEYLQTGAYVMWEEDGEQYVALRRSLYVSTQDGYVRRTGNLLGGLTEAKGQWLVKMAVSSDENLVTQGLLELGAPAPLHYSPEKTITAFNRFALVGLGPRAAACWRQEACRKDSCLLSSLLIFIY